MHAYTHTHIHTHTRAYTHTLTYAHTNARTYAFASAMTVGNELHSPRHRQRASACQHDNGEFAGDEDDGLMTNDDER